MTRICFYGGFFRGEGTAASLLFRVGSTGLAVVVVVVGLDSLGVLVFCSLWCLELVSLWVLWLG